MIVYCVFIGPELQNYGDDPNGFAIDADANGTVEDLKVQISLSYSDVDPAKVDLKYNGVWLQDSTMVHSLNYQPHKKIEVHLSSWNPCPACVIY